ncbi:MAG TPA: rhodanese-like domain-containing protein, partial [Trueperaceae bacterium]|nr:rhodanese-like domain-containing protein [Trueperaceae bacterium]
EEWAYRFEHLPLKHGDVIEVGNIRVEVMHTPGHTPEHLAFLVTDTALTDLPGYLLTGDWVFVGDVGRPDLLDEAAGGVDTRFEGARRLFATLRDQFMALPDHVQLWPGHGAGSACGKALGAVASSTVGYEKLTAWWRGYVAKGDGSGFTAELLAGQPDAPSYFGRMKRVNRDGPPVLGRRPAVERLEPSSLAGRVNRDLVLVDTRGVRQQWQGSVPGALAIPGGASFATYAGYVFDPDLDRRGVVVLAADARAAETFRDRLSYVGIDTVIGYVTSFDGLELRPARLMTPAELGELVGDRPTSVTDAAITERPDTVHLFDVRSHNEHVTGAVPGSSQIHAGQVLRRLDEVPRGGKLVLYCQGGGRAAAVAGLLRARGFGNVYELEGSFDGWSAHVR